MLTDLKFALRQIAKSPGYAIVVVLTLAFGLAVNSTIFGMINGIFLRPLGVPEEDRVVLILQRSEAWQLPHQISFPDMKDYRERLTTIRDIYATLPLPAHLSAEGKSPERVFFELVTPNAFQSLGVGVVPGMGRTLLPSDGEAAGGPPVTVLSHTCWQTRFGGDPEIVGKNVIVNGHPFEVVGVAPEKFNGFMGLIASSGFVPTSAVAAMRDDGAGILEWRSAAAWRTFGRLAPGATLADAQAEAAVVTQQLVSEYPDEHRGVTSVVLPEPRARPDPIFADFLPILAALFAGMVAMVLLIACANVANLMFARTALRQRELSMRAALGASRGRLIRQLLVESVLLAMIAGVVSWLLAMWGGVLLAEYAPKGDTPVAFETAGNWRDYVFTTLASLAAGFAAGIWPAWRASRIDVNESLKAAAGGRVSAGRHWMRNLLVVSQVAFSLVVLVSAALFLRSLQKVQGVDLGFEPDRLLIASFDLKLQGYDEKRAAVFQDQVLQRVLALPGVESAAFTTHVPFDYNSTIRDVYPENPAPTLDDGAVSVSYAQVSPGFIDMLGLRMREGRQFTDADNQASAHVAIVNQAFAQKCWPGDEVIGKRFRPWRDGPWIEIVGLTETAKYVMLTEDPRPFYYVPLAQDFSSPVTIMLRTAGDPAASMNAVRQAVREVDEHLPVYDVRVHAEIMGNSIFAYMPMRMGATLAGTQGVIGVFLAIMGLFSVVSFGVTQRTREIGVRIALGAQPGRIVRTMLVEGLVLTGVGLVIGSVLAAGVGFVMSMKVYGLAPVEPLILGGVALLLLGTAALACWWPARRASRVDPMVALRTE